MWIWLPKCRMPVVYIIRTNDAAGISEIHNVDAKLLTNGD